MFVKSMSNLFQDDVPDEYISTVLTDLPRFSLPGVIWKAVFLRWLSALPELGPDWER